MRLTQSLSVLTLSAAVLSVSGRVQAQLPGPCWEDNLGTSLGLTDDSLSGPQALGFTFPIEGGSSTTDIDVSSNGFVWLEPGTGSNGCCNGDVTALITDPARIAVCWMDLNPTAGGDVLFNTFTNRAVVTWLDVPEFGQTAGAGVSVQLQLFSDGTFLIATRSVIDPGTHDLLVGISAGNGAVDPGEVDLDAMPNPGGSDPTAYEFFDNTIPDVRDLGLDAIYFLPNGSGGYITLPQCRLANWERYGAGCPQRGAFFEEFLAGAGDLGGTEILYTAGNSGWVGSSTSGMFDATFTNNLALGDDQLATGLALGFTFPFPGGSTTTIDVDSNGWIGLVSGEFQVSDFSESSTQLLEEGARIAAYWDDLNPFAAGGVYFDASATKATITWDSVPQFGNTDVNTFQVQLFPNGNMVFAYQAGCSDDGITGWSAGNVGSAVTSIDLSATIPTFFGPFGNPLVLDSASAPTVGSNFVMDVSDIPTGAALAIISIGVNQIALDLTPIGAPGCIIVQDGVASLPLTLTGMPTASATLPIPNTPALTGGVLYAQTLMIVPGINQLGGIVSNGAILTLGQ